MRFFTTIFFAPDDETGAAVEVAEQVTEPVSEVVEATPVEQVAETEQVTEPVVDWAARVNEWGGEDTVAQAIALQQALATRDGVQALFQEAGRALGLGDAAIAALFEDATAAEPEPSVEDILADPDRILTAGEIQRILDARTEQQQAQTREQQQAQAVLSSIEDAFETLKIADEEDRLAVLAIADTYVPQAQKSDPAAISSAIRRAHEHFQAKVAQQAEAIVRGRAETNEQLPNLLPTGGGSGGGESPTEPQTLEEAKRLARKQLGIS
jgi:hypothetical protein